MKKQALAYLEGVAVEFKLAWNGHTRTWDLIWRRAGERASETRRIHADIDMDHRLIAALVEAVTTEMKVQEQDRNGARGWRAEYLEF